MSIDFTVVCRKPLPPEWTNQLPEDDLPFYASAEAFAEWKEGTLEWLAEVAPEERDHFHLELTKRLEGPWSFVLHLNCRAAGAELTDLCAREVVERFGGFYYDDHTAELSEVLPGNGEASARAVEAAWRVLIADKVAFEEGASKIAKKEWQEAAKKDPSVSKDNDWSDV